LRPAPPQTLRERVRLTASYLKALPRVFQLVRESSRTFAVGIVLLLLGQSLLPAFGSFTGTHPVQPIKGDRVFAIGSDEVAEIRGVARTRA